MRKAVARSPVWLLTTTMLCVFGVDLGMEIAISNRPSVTSALGGWGRGMVDAVALTILLGPLLYLFLFRPLVSAITEHGRTSKFLEVLYRAAEALNRATNAGEVAAAVLEQVLTLPDVQTGWISLREGEVGFRLGAARNLPPALEAPGAMDGDCLCRRMLRSGELRRATNILECERLQRARGDTRGLRVHLSIPLWIGDRTLGVMNLAGPVPGMWRDEDLTILNGVGNHVAIALERTRLLEHLEDEVKRRTDALGVREEQYRTLVEESLQGICIHQDFVIQFANSAMARIFGYDSAESLVGRDYRTLFAPAEQTRLNEYYAARVRHEPVPSRYDVEGARRDRAAVWLELLVSAIHWRSAPAVQVAALDITERKQADDARARLTAIIEATTDFVGIAHEDGRVVYYNRAARRLLRIGEDEDIAGIRIPDAHPEWAGRLVVSEAIPAAIRNGVWSGETALLSRDGREIPVSQVIIAHKTADGRVEFLSTIARDLTEARRAEAMRRQTEKLAAMGELLAGVAHELNNPLSVVLGHTALLRRTAGPGPVAERAEKIAQSAERCARIVKNFLALARQYPPERQKVQLNEIVREAVELLAYPLRVDTVEVTLDLASDLPTLWADPHQLHQAMVNLITNAHYALRQVSRSRHLIIVTRSDPAKTRISLEVTDTGPGIPSEVRARMFEPFFTTKPPGQGTGLGLSLCRTIIEGHEGSIGAESQPGQGATFRIDLPITAPPADRREADLPEARPAVRGKAILVVDDEPEVAEMVAELLSADGHRVEVATNGAVALTKLRDQTYDLILSDIKMPELDGPGLYREVERQHPSLTERFVFMTGDALTRETQQFLAQAGRHRVSKPFSSEELRRAIQQVLRPHA